MLLRAWRQVREAGRPPQLSYAIYIVSVTVQSELITGGAPSNASVGGNCQLVLQLSLKLCGNTVSEIGFFGSPAHLLSSSRRRFV